MSKKCDRCEKNITKNVPGVECSKCECVVHLNTKCTGLTSKQITALKAAPCLEWTCQKCQDKMQRKNSSIVVPSDDDDDVDDTSVTINSKKLLTNISKEVEKAMKKEMRELNDALQFHSSKMDEILQCVEIFKNTIKDLERKNTALTNKTANLEIRVGAMEQRIQKLEQEKLGKFLEIANVPTDTNEEAKNTVENLAAIIKQPKDGIKITRRLHARKDLPSIILVELRDEDTQEKWLTEVNCIKPCVPDVHPTSKTNKDAVYVREAMTQHNKQLLWNAKRELKTNQNYKYVWFKKGHVKAKKDDNDKIYTIRSMEDIQSLITKKNDKFQSIVSVDDSLSEAKIVWRDNWTTFIDGILQLNALRQSHNAVSQPRSIRQIVIDTAAHKNAILHSEILDGNVLLRAKVSEKNENTRCGGVIIENIKFLHLPSFTENKMDLKSLNFIPFSNSGLQVRSLLEVYFQIVAENLNKTTLTVVGVGVGNQVKKGIMFENINGVIENTFGIKVNYKYITREMAIENYKFEDVDMILVENVSDDDKLCQRFQEVLERDKFIVNEIHEELHSSGFSSIYCLLSVHTNEHIKLQLVRWRQRIPVPAIMAVSVHKEADLDIWRSVRTNLTAGCQVLVIASYPTPPGLKELISRWRNETDRNNVLLVTINNSGLPLKRNQNKMASENVSLQGAQLSDFDSLKWVAIPELTRSGITVNVHYAGINTNDLKKANGWLLFKNKVNSGYGMDYSGITESGKRVMGIVHNGAASKQVKARPELLWPVPTHWSLEDAATVPLAYVQAFYCLGIKVGLPRGKSVFVHGGAGALGQAIISIALYLDCEVFTTVSNIHKKDLLLKLFPTLKADHIGCSRDNTFTDMVEIISEGKRCDIAISCVKGNLKDCTMRCLNVGGILYDISQIQDGDDYYFGMSTLCEERSYVSVDFSSVFNVENLDELKTIHKMVCEGIARGSVRPLTRVTYAPRDVARAFRLLAASSHRGRVLLRMADSTIQAQYRMRCTADRSNLILCGKTAFGLQFADRLVARGAKQLYLHVPTQSPYLQHKMRAWQSLGIQVTVSSEPLNKQQTINSLLKSSLQFGHLEGVYIIAEETDDDHNLISHLDAELRKLCCDLSHFAVVYFGDNSTGKDVCLKRLSDQLPALILQLPEVKEASYGSYMNWQAAVDALEQALQSAHGVTIAHENKHKPSLLQQIAKLVGLSIPDNAAKSLTLAELGIQNHKLQLLCTFLQIQYNLTFDEKQVSSLTINTILNLGRNIFSFPHEDIRGLSTFINYIDSDELTATTELVILPTLVTASYMRDDEFRHDQIKLCIVPGLEGHHERFRVLCERLKIAAVAVQPGLDHPNETVTETAQRYAEVLLKKTETKDKFCLLGYESGICVALEIAAILESHGFTGTVFCVGCTPEELKTEFEEQMSPLENEEQLQEKVLRHMYSLMTENDPAELDHAIQNLRTWSQKIETCVRILLGRVSHSAQYARSLIECALARINQIRNYSIATRQLRSQVILIRAAIGHSSLEDSVLQHISQQPLVVYRLNTPLAHITADLRCSAIINEHLDPKIREEFANRNTCDTYLLNVDNFIALVA